MVRARLVTIGVAASLLVAGCLLFVVGGSASGPVVRAPRVSEAHRRVGLRLDEEAPPIPDAAPPSAERSVAAAAGPPQDGPWCRVDYPDGTPAPFAEVRVSPRSEALDLRVHDESGWRYVADEEGRVRLPAGANLVTASRGGWWGVLDRSRYGDEERVLVLERDENVVLRLDPAGALPPGSTVTLRALPPGDVPLGPVDADGWVTLAHAQEHRERVRIWRSRTTQGSGEPDHESAVAWFDVWLGGRRIHSFATPWSSLTVDGSVRVALPRFRELCVRLVDADGRRFEGDAIVRLESAADPDRPASARARRPEWGRVRDVPPPAAWATIEPAVRGVVTVPGVAVGESLVVVAAPVDGRFVPVSRRLEVGASEEATCAVTLAFERARRPSPLRVDPTPTLAVRLVDARGVPLSDVEVWWEYPDEGSPNAWFLDEETGELRGRSFELGEFLRSDADGRVEVKLAGAEVLERVDVECTLWLPDRELAQGYAIARLHGRLVPGANDVGDAVVRAPQVLAAGRILDGRGRPVPGALVTGPGGARAVADEGGVFLLVCDRSFGDVVWLSARAPGTGPEVFDSTRASVSHGDRDVTLRVNPRIVLRGRLRLPDGAPPEAFLVRLRQARTSFPAPLDDAGGFEAWVLDFPTRVIVTLAGDEATRLLDLEVDPSIPSDRERLASLDVSTAARVGRIRVVDQQDRPVPAALIKVDGARRLIRADAQGELRHVFGDRPVTFLVGGPTGAGAKRVALDGDATVRLELDR